jgi:hypothetical protein
MISTRAATTATAARPMSSIAWALKIRAVVPKGMARGCFDSIGSGGGRSWLSGGERRAAGEAEGRAKLLGVDIPEWYPR